MATITKLRTMEKMEKILKLKEQGVPEQEVITVFKNNGFIPPSPNTVHKYYTSEDEFTKEKMTESYQKNRAFDEPNCKSIIIKCMNSIGKQLKISSLYDLLQEKLVEEARLFDKLPGNEQTLRNYCKYLVTSGQVEYEAKKRRIYDIMDIPEPGNQVQVDYGVQKLLDGTHFHFIALLLRHSRLLYIKGMDHKFDAEATCNALYTFFSLIGGRPKQLVIDQDSCMIYEEKYGEITTTKVFGDFLAEQDLKLYVCYKADPESKGSIENTVKFVKLNYLPSRLNWSVKELCNDAPNWCRRKNLRIHRTEYWIPNDRFIEYEKNALLPLYPSQYDVLNNKRLICRVDKTHAVRFQTNTYVLPREYSYGYVYKKITKNSILFYKTETGNDLICSYSLPQIDEKHKKFFNSEFKQERGRDWEKINDEIFKKYSCKNMLHYINGLKKENVRHRNSQFAAFLRLLNERFTTTNELDEILGIACNNFRYQVGQLYDIWNSYWEERNIVKETKKQQEYIGIQGTLNLENSTVQYRNTEDYQHYFDQQAGINYD